MLLFVYSSIPFFFIHVNFLSQFCVLGVVTMEPRGQAPWDDHCQVYIATSIPLLNYICNDLYHLESVVDQHAWLPV